ncbi:hypothetical protein HY491_03055 [Candidatus Woesearchaeota archaeon]|nr:hypothetical protein [Candidatus Woesearchaeota archaeon]
MSKRHLKRIAAPRTWAIGRKSDVYTIRPFPGAHSLKSGLPLQLLLQGAFPGLTAREVRYMLQRQEVLVDGRRRKEKKHIVGLFDVVALPALQKQYRVMISKTQALSMREIPPAEAEWKVCKIVGMHRRNARETWLHLSSGRNILVQKHAYHIGDSLVIRLPGQEIVSHFPFQKGSWVYLTAGNHAGKLGIVEDAGGSANKVGVRSGDETFETLKKYTVVVGKDQPAVGGVKA